MRPKHTAAHHIAGGGGVGEDVLHSRVACGQRGADGRDKVQVVSHGTADAIAVLAGLERLKCRVGAGGYRCTHSGRRKSMVAHGELYCVDRTGSRLGRVTRARLPVTCARNGLCFILIRLTQRKALAHAGGVTTFRLVREAYGGLWGVDSWWYGEHDRTGCLYVRAAHFQIAAGGTPASAGIPWKREDGARPKRR